MKLPQKRYEILTRVIQRGIDANDELEALIVKHGGVPHTDEGGGRTVLEPCQLCDEMALEVQSATTAEG